MASRKHKEKDGWEKRLVGETIWEYLCWKGVNFGKIPGLLLRPIPHLVTNAPSDQNKEKQQLLFDAHWGKNDATPCSLSKHFQWKSESLM